MAPQTDAQQKAALIQEIMGPGLLALQNDEQRKYFQGALGGHSLPYLHAYHDSLQQAHDAGNLHPPGGSVMIHARRTQSINEAEAAGAAADTAAHTKPNDPKAKDPKKDPKDPKPRHAGGGGQPSRDTHGIRTQQSGSSDPAPGTPSAPTAAQPIGEHAEFDIPATLHGNMHYDVHRNGNSVRLTVTYPGGKPQDISYVTDANSLRTWMAADPSRAGQHMQSVDDQLSMGGALSGKAPAATPLNPAPAAAQAQQGAATKQPTPARAAPNFNSMHGGGIY